ncbi:PQQ-binding-like beta-propeller repeat protein [Sphingopyxis sp.]|jgi:quinohemoprotein ethanol dehydrogenase|uniref:outer membrane protein assembly factor BamB family protein n=1 Tax=Sphingopyxis sp. TaxID=1908224 RepID=UPI002DEB8D14|nr:PQQ-binding-like beta-propeller repeat protein [Sphingopyxis sp.]
MLWKRRNFARLTLGVTIAGMAAAALTLSANAGADTTDQSVEAPDAAEWRLMGNGPGQLFHSPIDQINDKNVSSLGLAWSVDLPTKDGPVGNILVADGVAYQSAAGGRVFAVSLEGKLLWEFDPEPNFTGAALTAFMGARFQRGLALEGDQVFISTPDCRLIALDKVTGKKNWDKLTCDKTGGFTQTGAPQVGAGLVFTGNSCMDIGGRRGFVNALDQKTGEEKWRFHVVPQFPEEPAGGQESPAHEMAAKTWGQPTQQVGCGGAYGGMTYDPALNLLYVSTSGAGPWSPTGRGKGAGDELFAGSIVALNADTGEYVWHYKLAPNDGWNWEAFQSIVTDLTIDGQKRRVLMNAPKHGFLITLDAKTGEFISGIKTTEVNWAKGFDAKGVPILTGEANYWEKGSEGALIAPMILGSHVWQPMSFSPKTGLIYIPVGNGTFHIATRDDASVGGVIFDFNRNDPKHPLSGSLVAIDPVTQEIRWQVTHKMVYNGGVLSTAGNLVFEGTGDGYFQARAADTGKLLWSKYLGGSLQGAPSTVIRDGEQYILLPFGNANSSGTGVSSPQDSSCEDCRQAPSRILAFKLGGKQVLPANPKLPPVPKPPLPRFSKALSIQGMGLYNAAGCEVCHGLGMVNGGGTAPDLHRTDEARHGLFKEIVRDGLLNQTGMPRFSYLSDDDLQALQAYMINNAWDAYDAGRNRKARP